MRETVFELPSYDRHMVSKSFWPCARFKWSERTSQASSPGNALAVSDTEAIKKISPANPIIHVLNGIARVDECSQSSVYEHDVIAGAQVINPDQENTRRLVAPR